MSAVSAVHLTVAYGEHTALREVSLEVGEGKVLGLLGPNGAGKSTLVRTCLGLLRPVSGTVRVLGLDPIADGERVRRQVGFVLEQSGLYRNLSCRANLEFYARIYRIEPEVLSGRVDEALERFGLVGRARDPAGTLSKGLSQRLALARALLHRPRLIFLDEPTSGLDPAAALELRQVLAGVVREASVTVVLTTHNMLEAERLCDSITVIRTGEVVGVLDRRKIANLVGIRVRSREMTEARAREAARRAGAEDVHRLEGTTEFIFSPEVEPDRAGERVAQAGVEVTEIVRSPGSLEAVYLELTGGVKG